MPDNISYNDMIEYNEKQKALIYLNRLRVCNEVVKIFTSKLEEYYYRITLYGNSHIKNILKDGFEKILFDYLRHDSFGTGGFDSLNINVDIYKNRETMKDKIKFVIEIKNSILPFFYEFYINT